MYLRRRLHLHDVRLLVVAVTGATIAAGCSSGTEPKAPSSVEVTATTPTGTAGLPLATPPTFTVKDAAGNPIGGVPVTITVTAGGGTITGAPTTTVSGGPTPIGTWTLGKIAGPNVVTVTVGDLAPVTITVVGAPGKPASIAVVSGDNQSAIAGADLPQPLTVQVRDQFGNGVPGITVTVTTGLSGGSVTPSTLTTGPDGNASGIVWKLGKSALPQAIIISAAGVSTIASATVQSDFTVDLRFFGPTPSEAAMGAFTEAAARIRGAILGDVPSEDFLASSGLSQPLDECGVPGVVLNEVVDDIVIYATVTPIDGPGKVLANAGPCYIRVTQNEPCVPPVPAGQDCYSFPVVGVMRFDADDIAGLVSGGRLKATVLHEMMHVIGVGTIWDLKGLLVGSGSNDPRYTGPLGIAGCNEAGGTAICATGIPVENVGGPGSVDGHWRESVFGTELMTSVSAGNGVAMPLSKMTVQSLADLGYTVNTLAADPYTIPSTAGILGTALTEAGADGAFDTVRHPIFGVSRSGKVHRIIKQ